MAIEAKTKAYVKKAVDMREEGDELPAGESGDKEMIEKLMVQMEGL